MMTSYDHDSPGLLTDGEELQSGWRKLRMHLLGSQPRAKAG